jgi:hypothetical protein
LKASIPFQGGLYELWSYALSPDGSTVAIGIGDNNGHEGRLTVYSVSDLKPVFPPLEQSQGRDFGPVSAIKFTADGKIIGSSHFDSRKSDKASDEWKYWDATGKPVAAPGKNTKWADPTTGGTLHVINAKDDSVELHDDKDRLRAALRAVAVQRKPTEKDEWGSRIAHEPLDWVWSTPDGHYVGSPGGEKLVTYPMNGEIKPASEFPALRSVEAVIAALRVK